MTNVTFTLTRMLDSGTEVKMVKSIQLENPDPHHESLRKLARSFAKDNGIKPSDLLTYEVFGET